MGNAKINVDESTASAARIIFSAFPYAAFDEIVEDRLILNVGEGIQNVRILKKWIPYERAKLEYSEV